jgi:hypothetical protein
MKWTPAAMGKKGGSKKGVSKKRGDSEYYKAIRAKRTEKQKAGALHYSLQQTLCDSGISYRHPNLAKRSEFLQENIGHVQSEK